MIPLNSILSIAIKDYLSYLPLAIGILCGVILLGAFIRGCIKGFRRVSWMMLVGLLAFGLFVIGCKALAEKGKIPSSPSDSADTTALTLIALAAICALLALIIYGIAASLFRPRWKWALKSKTYVQNGFEYEDDEEEYDSGYEQGKTLVWKNAGKPTWIGRLLGGVMCVANTAVAMGIVGALALVVINATSAISDSSVGAQILGNQIVAQILPYAVRYAFDFVIILTIVWTAYKGFKYGLVDGVRAILLTFGGIAVTVLGFWLPFSPFVQSGTLSCIGNFSAKLSTIFSKIESQMIRDVLGKVLAGVLICSVLLPVLALINSLLKKLSRAIKYSPFMRTLDGCLSCLVFLAVGVWACCEIIELMCILEYAELINVEEYFASGSLIDVLFNFFKDSAKALLTKIMG